MMRSTEPATFNIEREEIIVLGGGNETRGGTIAEPNKSAYKAADDLAQECGLGGFERPLAKMFDAYVVARVAEARAQEREAFVAMCREVADSKLPEQHWDLSRERQNIWQTACTKIIARVLDKAP